MVPSPSQTTEPPGNGVGPHPSFIQPAKPYIFEYKLQESIAATGISESREDSIRLQGVAWIDNVRKACHLPVRTYNTACVYYHRFRLATAENEYGFIDAAAAALFTACKIEDTLKKSSEILSASYNLKLSTAEQVSSDDVMFKEPSKTVIGTERQMLEASGFDFRNRYPQKLLLKLAKYYTVNRETVGKTAYNMSLDLYRTFAPLKQTTATMAIACLELSGRILEQHIGELEAGADCKKWKVTRQEVMETLLDLLDLYTHHRASTVVGQDHAIETFISIRIALNQESSTNSYPRHTNGLKKKKLSNGVQSTNGTKSAKAVHSPHDDLFKDTTKSPQTPLPVAATAQRRAGMKDGTTIRFMLDAERARDEKAAVAEYFKMEEEEYEIEIERERRRGSSANCNAVSRDQGADLEIDTRNLEVGSDRVRHREPLESQEMTFINQNGGYRKENVKSEAADLEASPKAQKNKERKRKMHLTKEEPESPRLTPYS